MKRVILIILLAFIGFRGYCKIDTDLYSSYSVPFKQGDAKW